MNPLVPDQDFVDFAWTSNLIPAAKLLALKDAKRKLEAEGRPASMHELAREEKLLSADFEGGLAAFVAARAKPEPTASPDEETQEPMRPRGSPDEETDQPVRPPVRPSAPTAARPAGSSSGATPKAAPAGSSSGATSSRPPLSTPPASVPRPSGRLQVPVVRGSGSRQGIPAAAPPSAPPAPATAPSASRTPVAAPPATPANQCWACGAEIDEMARMEQRFAVRDGKMLCGACAALTAAPAAPAPVAPAPPAPEEKPELTKSGSRSSARRHTSVIRRGGPRAPGPSKAPVFVAGAVLAVGGLVGGMVYVMSSNGQAPEAGPTIAAPAPPPAQTPPPPPPTEEHEDHDTPPPVQRSPLRIADAAIASARRLRSAGDLSKARFVLESTLRDADVAAHPIASDLLKKELELVARAEAPAKTDETPEETRPEEPKAEDMPRPRKPPKQPEDVNGDALGTLRARAAALDLEGARSLLSRLDPQGALAEGGAIDARAAFLDALGAALSPGATIQTSEGGKRQKIQKCSSKGISLEGGENVPWTRFPRPVLVDFLNASEKGAAAAHEGAALVLYDFGLWAKGDQRVKVWLDQDANARLRAFALVARARGLERPPADGWTWRGEWLSADEDQTRARDSVLVDGRLVARDEARKLVENRKKERKPTKASQKKAERARAERLLADFGVTDVRTIVSSGDPAKRCDVVLVSDGFAEGEIAKFERVCDGIANALKLVEPWRNYPRYVNVHRITVVDSRSGIPGRLGSMEKNGILHADYAKAVKWAELAPDVDLVMVVANVTNVRSSAVPGVIALKCITEFDDTVIHELGHAFADLDDEYEDSTVVAHHPDWSPDEERRHVNTTREANALRCKWHYWLLPPDLGDADKVGCFQGAYYRPTGYYRPSAHCRMREHGYRKYCAVCLEKMEKSLYERLEPIDDATPRAPEVVLWRDDLVRFEATAIEIATAGEKLGGFQAFWWLDGRSISPRNNKTKTALEVTGGTLSAGEHQVALRVDLNDVRVRRDDGLLSSSRAWRLRVLDAAKPKLSAPEMVAARRGDAVAFDVTLEGGLPEARVALAKGPPGAFLLASGRSGRFVWVPPREARGAFRAVFSAGEGAARIERAAEISIQDEAHDVSPVLADPGAQNVVRGHPFELQLEAYDPDGDALVFSSKKLPPGAELDPSGLLRWTPGYSAPFESDLEVPIHVTDGRLTDDLAVKLHVDCRPIGGAGPGFDLLVGTRSPYSEVRAAALAELPKSELATDAKILELSRLLRDEDPNIARNAAASLRELTMPDGSPALEGRRALLALDLSAHTWQLTDRPEALALLKDLTKTPLEGEAKAVGAKIAKDLVAIDKYNRERGR